MQSNSTNVKSYHRINFISSIKLVKPICKCVYVVEKQIFSQRRFSMGFGYYVLSLGNNDLVGNRFLNLFLSSLTDIFSSVLYFFAVKKCGRRDSYMLSGTLMALCIAVLGLVQNGKTSPYFNLVMHLSSTSSITMLVLVVIT